MRRHLAGERNVAAVVGAADAQGSGGDLSQFDVTQAQIASRGAAPKVDVAERSASLLKRDDADAGAEGASDCNVISADGDRCAAAGQGGRDRIGAADGEDASPTGG